MLPAIVSKKFLKNLEDSTGSEEEEVRVPIEHQLLKPVKMERRRFKRQGHSPTVRHSINPLSPQAIKGDGLIFSPKKMEKTDLFKLEKAANKKASKKKMVKLPNLQSGGQIYMGTIMRGSKQRSLHAYL